ncbi:MAG: 2-hydroxyglutaryl-CoA dehydratase [Ruminococcaceae bacterium]|nr:2-hydroxyglutaryl-CoA dehydratase [Oscillospiraceae bacterium]
MCPEYPVFTEEMKKTHTILLPMMLPIHFSLMCKILHQEGYKAELLQNDGPEVIEEGLRYVHNDTCYPALLVIGQFISALKSGRYDTNKTALMITQTGGGCRASNYIFLLRKALLQSGFGHVPVISLNASGLDSSPGFKLSLTLGLKLCYAAIAGDFMMHIGNQCRPYEVTAGDTDRVIEKWTDYLLSVWDGKKVISYRHLKSCYPKMLADFDAIPKTGEKKPRVGIVGEIYVKYSPMGNNKLEEFLLSEGCEVVLFGLADFCQYCLSNVSIQRKLYGGKLKASFVSGFAYRVILSMQKHMAQAINRHGVFWAPNDFNKTKKLAEKFIGPGVQMGEGWLLTVEMAELIEKGVNNVVCTQPFGCLPNHIVGKGMMNTIKAHYPHANLVAIDYDPGASTVNQQNRIKLMLANIREEDARQVAPDEKVARSQTGQPVTL